MLSRTDAEALMEALDNAGIPCTLSAAGARSEYSVSVSLESMPLEAGIPLARLEQVLEAIRRRPDEAQVLIRDGGYLEVF
jgi:hypothetical protein